MTNKEIILDFLSKHNGIITYKNCRQLGVPTIYLTRLEKEGILFRVEKGIFISDNGDYDEYYFFQYRYPKAIFSNVSSLYLQGFTDEIPQYFEVTVPRGYRFNKPPINLNSHWVSKEFSELGVTEVTTAFGNKVKAYNLERNICDLIKHKDSTDKELFVKTLKSYSRYPQKNINRLYKYAKKMNILTDVKETMEILL